MQRLNSSAQTFLGRLATRLPIFKSTSLLCELLHLILIRSAIVIFRNEVVLPEKKRAHDGSLIVSEKKIVRKLRTFIYPDLNKVLILPDTKQRTEAIKKVKRRNPLFYLMLILIEFRNKMGRDPHYSKKEEDIEKLKEIKEDVLHLYEVSADKVNDSLFDLVFGEMAPVCSVVGGMLAQEVIKAVSYTEVPVNNMFLFDPVTYAGMEECVGA